jgi:hypothetical protein
MTSESTYLLNLYKKNERKIAYFEYFKHYHCYSIALLLTSSWLYFADNLTKTLLSFLILTFSRCLILLLCMIYRRKSSKVYMCRHFFIFFFVLSRLKSHGLKLKEMIKVLLYLIILTFFYHVVTFSCCQFIGKI